MIKAVIFDMDGVLIDAREWHYEALNRALREYGFEINRDEHMTIFNGLPTREKLLLLTKMKGLAKEHHATINNLKQKYTMEMVYLYCQPQPEHQLALSALKNENYKLAVASNSIRHSVEVMMEKSNLGVYLDAMMSAEDVKYGKPHPEIYEKTMALLGFKPDECLVVEDNENGIRAAQAAGAHLMIVKDTVDVTLDNIRSHIQKAESQMQ